MVSTRAQIITRRTYNRPIDDNGQVFETWMQTIDRTIEHQRWLWERALGRELTFKEELELRELTQLMYERKVSLSGRTLWLGGTDVAKNREASQFNCAFTKVETVYDVVDVLWLLLQGCGVGFQPVVGTLNGFLRPINTISMVPTERTGKGGNQNNVETWDPINKIWTIKIGDSAEAWAKSIGKILAGKYPANELILDFSEIRPAGERLKGYGWISSGDTAISKAYYAICQIMNKRAESLLTRIDILDIVNWLGTILSSRRSAEIALFEYGEPEWQEFTVAKKDYYEHHIQRGQSNNSLMFRHKPTRSELEDIFERIKDAGGSEPGFINAAAALKRAPWFAGVNPCAEILLANKSFCNLTETDVAKFEGDSAGLQRAIYLSARANYRQTCVNLRDGILQESWHLNNEFLRLCGVGLTGIVKRNDLGPYEYSSLQRTAIFAAYSMADELGTQRPKNVTTIKPSGTLSKVMDTTEGAHKPLGRYIFNNVNFSKHDPLIPILRASGYRVFDNPGDPDGILVTLPVEYSDVKFDIVDDKEVNLESAVKQLERYKMLQTYWAQHNTSITISYDLGEVQSIINWLLENWDVYVGVSFLYRNDPTKTAKDLGYEYLPQEVVTKEVFQDYLSRLQPIDIDHVGTLEELRDQECSTGACPIR